MKETFGQKLQRWREAAHVSQAELARRMDVSRNYISNLERDFSPTAKGGKPQPSVETCDKIARALGVKIAEVRLAAGYAPPAKSEEESAEMKQESEQAVDRAAEGARTMEMIENWAIMTPEEQTAALAFLKFLKAENPEALRILGPRFKVKDSSDITQSEVEETPDR
jgi:transcriptional regulator with XRE-family HTH domain